MSRLTVGVLSLLALALALALTGWVVFYAVSHNRNSLEEVVDHLRRVEQRDRDNLRRAALRICARDQLERAEIHAAYQQQIPPADPEVLAAEPVLKFLLESAEANRTVALVRVRRNLPILDCRPNLSGEPAVPLSDKSQARYVARYLANRLDPTPGDDVLPVEQP